MFPHETAPPVSSAARDAQAQALLAAEAKSAKLEQLNKELLRRVAGEENTGVRRRRRQVDDEGEREVRDSERAALKDQVRQLELKLRGEQSSSCPASPVGPLQCPVRHPCPLCHCGSRSSSSNVTGAVSLKPYRNSILNRSLALLRQHPEDIAVHFVSHTHWDREWYRPLEQFRRLLVTIMDRVVDRLVAPASGIDHFHLDAQTVLLEDYMSARPHLKELLIDLVNNDQLAVGPWYTQPDEFLASGEALVRNLGYGIRILRQLGSPNFSPIGYVPDQFGHTSQMPQIFEQFGLIAAATMRGVPDNINRNAWWVGPDGTRILMLKFSNYCGIHFNENRRDKMFDKLEEKLDKKSLKDVNETVSTLYFMNGCDHRDLDTRIGPMLRQAQEGQAFRRWNFTFGDRDVGVREVVHSNLRDVALLVKEEVAMKKVALPELVGELRVHVDHLSDVTSSGASLKRRNWAAQELLEVWAEPLLVVSQLLLANHTDEAADLERAWKLVLENHFHDTLCTTSVPMVLEEARMRADKAIEIAETLASQAMARLMEQSAPLSESAVFVFNPTNVPRQHELVVVMLRVTRSVDCKAGDQLPVLDVATDTLFNATVVDYYVDAWDFRHKRGLFRKGTSFGLLKVAMRPPLVHANEARLFAVKFTSISLTYPDPAATTAATPIPSLKRDEEGEGEGERKNKKRRKKKKTTTTTTTTTAASAAATTATSTTSPAEDDDDDDNAPPAVPFKYLEDEAEMMAESMSLKSAQKKEEEKRVFAAHVLSNDVMEVEINENDGSINVMGRGLGLTKKWFRLNQVKVVEEEGSQYLASFGSEVEPEVLERTMKVTRNAEFQRVKFAVRFTIPEMEREREREAGAAAAGDEEELEGAWRRKVRARKLRQQGSWSWSTPRPRETKEVLTVNVMYVLPAGSARHVLVRVWFSNHPNSGMRNFALRVEHTSRCKLTESISDNAFDHVRRRLDSLPDTKPYHRWVLTYGQSCALGLAGRGLYELRAREKQATATLLRAVNRIGDWAAFPNDAAQDFGSHHFEYSLFPLLPDADAAAAYDVMAVEGRKFASAMCALQNIDYGLLASSALPCVRNSELTRLASSDPGSGFYTSEVSSGNPYELFSNFANDIPEPTPVRHRVMLGARVTPPHLVLSALKQRDGAPDGIVVRVYNPGPKEVKGQLELAVPVRKAYKAKLNEALGEELTVQQGNSIELVVGHHKIVTVILFV